MNVFTNHDGATSTGRMISPFILAMAAFVLAAFALGRSDYLVMFAVLVGLVMLVWWLINLIDWLRHAQIERQERAARIHPQVLQYEALANLEAERVRLVHALRTLDAGQVALAREMGAVPMAICRGGSDTMISTWLELGSARIPWSFCAEWVDVLGKRGNELPPVRYWNDSRAREYAQIILDWLSSQSAILPGAGNRAAAWSPALTDGARWALLDRAGVTWCAHWWREIFETGTDESEEG